MTPDIENGKIAQKNLPGGALFHLGKFAIFNVQIKLQKKIKTSIYFEVIFKTNLFSYKL